MLPVYPHRGMTFAPTIAPDAHGGAVVGEWADFSCFAASGVCFKVKVTAAAGPINFWFETTSALADGMPDDAAAVQMGNCDICDDSGSYADGVLTIDPAAEPFASDGYVICTICVCCPTKFVRAVTDAGGNYDVEVIGRAKHVVRA